MAFRRDLKTSNPSTLRIKSVNSGHLNEETELVAFTCLWWPRPGSHVGVASPADVWGPPLLVGWSKILLVGGPWSRRSSCPVWSSVWGPQH